MTSLSDTRYTSGRVADAVSGFVDRLSWPTRHDNAPSAGYVRDRDRPDGALARAVHRPTTSRRGAPDNDLVERFGNAAL